MHAGGLRRCQDRRSEERLRYSNGEEAICEGMWDGGTRKRERAGRCTANQERRGKRTYTGTVSFSPADRVIFLLLGAVMVAGCPRAEGSGARARKGGASNTMSNWKNDLLNVDDGNSDTNKTGFRDGVSQAHLDTTLVKADKEARRAGGEEKDYGYVYKVGRRGWRASRCVVRYGEVGR